MEKRVLSISLWVSLCAAGILGWVPLHLKHTPSTTVPLNGIIAPFPKFKTSFQTLPGWQHNQFKKSLQAFQESCKVFLHAHPQKQTGNQHVPIKAKDWHPACLAAISLPPTSNVKAKAFFEHWFTPVELTHHRKAGLFTGYYMPTLKGSLVKTRQYSVPIYGVPSSHVNNTKIPTYTRKQIDQGAIAHTAPVLAWIASDVDRLFLEIEGSGNIELPDGKLVHVTYAGENGAHYTSIAKVLIQKGILSKHNASYQHIKQYLEAHPQEKKQILHKNQSFVFFQALKNNVALGAQGIALTQGYSLAIDKEWIPLGAPMWLTTAHPTQHTHKFQRLMVAQDTGGAIKGRVRGDIFFGAGEKAVLAAANMQSQGRYWLLLPKQVAERIKHRFT